MEIYEVLRGMGVIFDAAYLFRKSIPLVVSNPTILKRFLNPVVLLNYFTNLIEMKARRLKLKSLPPIFDIEVSNVCNLHCPMCLRQHLKRKGSVMSFRDFRYIIEQNDRLIGVMLGGWGEPFLNKDLSKMLQFLSEKGIIAGTVTNATLLSRELTDVLLDRKTSLFRLGISIDSPTTGIIRDYPDFDQVIKNIKYLVKKRELNASRKPILRLAMTVTQANVDEIPFVVKLAHQLGIDHVNVKTAKVFRSQQQETPYRKPDISTIKRIFQSPRS